MNHSQLHSVPRSRTHLLYFSWLLLLCAPHPARAQVSTTYRSRGPYSEGIAQRPKSAPTLELAAAMVDPREPATTQLPPSFKARFFLPPGAQFRELEIQEIKPRYYYKVGDVADAVKGRWSVGAANEFEWPTNLVVRQMTNQPGGPLQLGDLGAVVRLDGGGREAVEKSVAPVALYSYSPNRTGAVQGYRFVFVPNRGMSLLHQVRDKAGVPLLARPITTDAPSQQPVTIQWGPGNRPDGWYTLEVTGTTLADQKSVVQYIRFYHSRQLGN